MNNERYSFNQWKESSPGMMNGWMGGWMEVKAILRIAYSNQKRKKKTSNNPKVSTFFVCFTYPTGVNFKIKFWHINFEFLHLKQHFFGILNFTFCVLNPFANIARYWHFKMAKSAIWKANLGILNAIIWFMTLKTGHKFVLQFSVF